MFNSHNKNENGNISAAGAAVLLKFDFLSSLEKYLVPVYYINYPMTLYFQIQLIRSGCTLNSRNRIKSSIKNKREKFCYEKEIS